MAVTPPPKGEIKHLARLWRFLAPYKARVFIAFIALVTAAGCVLALGQGLRHVIDAGFGSGESHLLNQALGALLAVAVVLATATWFRSYGNENWEFDADGLMRRRIASINDLPIKEADRKYRWPLGRRPDDHPGLSARLPSHGFAHHGNATLGPLQCCGFCLSETSVVAPPRIQIVPSIKGLQTLVGFRPRSP